MEDLAETENQPLMHRGMPNFEWTPGIPINDEMEDEPEQALTIADYETGEGQPLIEEDIDIGEMIEDRIGENDLEIQEEFVENAVEEGLIIVPEDNIVSEEEEFVESEDDDESSNRKTQANIEVKTRK